MAKDKVAYRCGSCASTTYQWAGQCGDCGAWNSLSEVVATSGKSRFQGYAGDAGSAVMELAKISTHQQSRDASGIEELDRVLGGGLVKGSVVLMGGDPGIGKSTLLLQTSAAFSKTLKVLYVTGEESLEQVRLRAERLGLGEAKLLLLAETQAEKILHHAKALQPDVMVVDSIQTIFTEVVQSAPGSVSQVRESAAHLVRFAKMSQTALFLIGHVTKEGTLAGPRVLEHMVDTVLYFEGENGSRFRMIRAVKNRFGAANELGIFAMSDKGLKGITNPSAIFLNAHQKGVAGSVVMVTWEGTRPLLLEIQALVDDSSLGNPRRVVVGFDHNRLALILAVLSRHGGLSMSQQDVFVNVVGGAKVTETAVDLPALMAVVSSMRHKPLPVDLVMFGEVGLSGEIRPVQSGQERLKEAAKLGFKQALIPWANQPKASIPGMTLYPVKHLQEVMRMDFSEQSD